MAKSELNAAMILKSQVVPLLRVQGRQRDTTEAVSVGSER